NPGLSHPGHKAAPWVLSYLRSTLGLGAALECDTARRDDDRIYISRRDAPGRRIVNEDELMAHLAQYGYREVVLSGLPLIEQIKIFSSASRVISMHGAGLVNIAFSPRGARLVEILPKTWGMAGFYMISAGLSNDYLSYVTNDIVPASHGP